MKIVDENKDNIGNKKGKEEGGFMKRKGEGSKIFLLILQRRVAMTTTGRILVSQDGRVVPWGDT